MENLYDSFTLPNGLRVIGQRMSAFRSVAVGVWVRVGSVDETESENGYSHFIEHMLFKGTHARSARELAEEMDAIGGQVNAFTSKECTCFHAKVMDEHLERAMTLLSDLVQNAKFDPEDLEREKGVILEEISMVEDTPEDVVHDLLAQANFDGNPLSMPILGPAGNIAEATRERIVAYRDRFYSPKNAVLAVAGGYDPERVKDLAQRLFGAWQGGMAPARAPFTTGVKRRLFRQKAIEQAHLCLGFDGVAQGSDDLYPLTIFNTVLGGGMSSRLFQAIREQKGLAYSVYSYPSGYSGGGITTIYAGMSPKNKQAVVDEIARELLKMRREGIGRTEFLKAKEQLKGSYILGQESTGARMSAIGRAALLHEQVLTVDEIAGKVEATTLDDVDRLLQQVVSSEMSAALIGDKGDCDYSALEALK